MNDESPVLAEPIATPPKPAPLRNSHWCIHKSGRLGMIGDISSAPIQFHFETEEGLGPAEAVNVDDLAIAKFADLPDRLGYTRAQAAEMGYL